jgi:prepilin-type N-terminal cleavage/methylation domain-containing protein
MHAKNHAQAGMTITELMVAMIVMAIVSSQAFLLYANQHQTYIRQGSVIKIQQEARLVTEVILKDARMAGFLVPIYAGISGIDGGPNAPDVLCLSDPSIIATAAITNADRRLSGATLGGALTAGDGTVNLVASSMDIDGDGDPNDDFVIGNGIIISDGNSHHCARIVSFTAGAPDIDPAPPAGFNIAAGAGRAVPAIIYRVNANGLIRNSVLLSRVVENLQVEYAVDIDGDGSIGGGEFPVHDISGSDPNRIKGFQLSVLTRSEAEDPANVGSQMPIAGNHVAGVPDNFVRRRFTSTAVPRNL